MQNTILPAIFGTFYAVTIFLALMTTVVLAFEKPGFGGALLFLFWAWIVVVMISGPGAPRSLPLHERSMVLRSSCARSHCVCTAPIISQAKIMLGVSC